MYVGLEESSPKFLARLYEGNLVQTDPPTYTEVSSSPLDVLIKRVLITILQKCFAQGHCIRLNCIDQAKPSLDDVICISLIIQDVKCKLYFLGGKNAFHNFTLLLISSALH